MGSDPLHHHFGKPREETDDADNPLMRECDVCGKMIAKDARTCPNCGKSYTTAGGVFLAVLIALIIGGCVFFPK